jgi:hypothetical protein
LKDRRVQKREEVQKDETADVRDLEEKKIDVKDEVV